MPSSRRSRYLEGHSHVPDAYEKLLEGEREVDWQVVPNLDTFFTDVYTYGGGRRGRVDDFVS